MLSSEQVIKVTNYCVLRCIFTLNIIILLNLVVNTLILLYTTKSRSKHKSRTNGIIRNENKNIFFIDTKEKVLRLTYFYYIIKIIFDTTKLHQSK